MKSEYLMIRISEREKAEVKKAAAELQMSMSEYVIYLIRKELNK